MIHVAGIVETDGTLRYTCGEDVTVRVLLHRRNGSKKCPVELLYQNTSVLMTESNLLDLRDIEALLKHATTLQAGVPWHEILTAVAKELPDKAAVPWESVAKTLANYTVERKDCLWYPPLPKGEPVSLGGDPGIGKSAVLVKLICHLTTGTAFPTLFPTHPEHNFEPQHVVLFTYEDDPSSTILPRALINGGDANLVHIIEGKRDPKTGSVIPMTLQDLPLLEKLLQTYAPALMAFDPIQSFFGPRVDMNSAADTRPILDAVRNLCKPYGCTQLYIRHNGKSQCSKAVHAALGSIDITAHMRSALTLYTDPDDEQRRILAHAKSNGRTAPSMRLRLVGATCDVLLDTQEVMTLEDVRVDWDGKSDLTAEDLNAREGMHGKDTEEAQSALEQAREFLRELLKDGPCLAEDVHKAAKQVAIATSTLRRAKPLAGIKTRRRPVENASSKTWPWEWHLAPEAPAEDAPRRASPIGMQMSI